MEVTNKITSWLFEETSRHTLGKKGHKKKKQTKQYKELYLKKKNYMEQNQDKDFKAMRLL